MGLSTIVQRKLVVLVAQAAPQNRER
jgi:hypothetical protein